MSNQLSPLSDIDNVLNKRRLKCIKKNESAGYIRSSLLMIFVIAAAVFIFLQYFSFRYIRGNDMFPSLSDGDLTLCTAENEYKKNDVVFYKANEKQYTGRVVAKGGDRVDITENGLLIVNGTSQTGEIVFLTLPPEDWNGEITVPENSLFILGDYRTDAKDSREFGCISVDDVQDKVIALFRHRKF